MGDETGVHHKKHRLRGAAHEGVAQAPNAGRTDETEKEEAAEPARVQEHGEIDVVRLLVVVLRHELQGAEAQGLLDQPDRLLLAAEPAFGALVVALVERGPLGGEARDRVELQSNHDQHGEWPRSPSSPARQT